MLKLNLFCFCILVLLNFVHSAIVSYDGIELSMFGILKQRLGMYIPSNAPFPRMGTSVAIQWTFTNSDPSQDTIIDIGLWESDFNKGIGVYQNGKKEYCCYSDLYAQGSCTTLGGFIIPNIQGDNRLQHWIVNFTGQQSITFQTNYTILTEGVWRLWAVRCAADGNAVGPTITLTGNATWLNPYGQIPGSIFAFIPFYFVLSFIYVVLGISWAITSIKYRTSLLKLQNIIAGLIFTGFCENIFCAALYLQYNTDGTISFAFGFFTLVIVRLIMRIAAYDVLLILVKGYTIYRPRFRFKEKRNIIIMSVLYLFFGIIYETVRFVEDDPPSTFSSTLPSWIVYFCAAPASLLDFIYFVWIFWELFLTVITLHQRKDDARKVLFKILAKILMVTYVVTFAFYVFELIIVIGDFFDFWWKGWWVWDSYYVLAHCVILCIVVYLWIPTEDNEKYAYHEFEFTNAHGAEIALEPLEVKEIYENFKVLF